MKSILLSFVLATTCTLSMAQESAPVQVTGLEKKTWSADLAAWNYLSGETFVPASWNMFYLEDNLFEVRYNFDQTKALSLYYGHRLTSDLGSVDFSFTPAVGVTMYDSLSNVGLTTHTVFQHERWKLYTINQHNLPTSPGASSITYHWIDFSYYLTDWLILGASDQYYQVGDVEGNFDLGPSLGFEAGSFYAKGYAWDVWSDEDRYYGIWCGWYFSNEE